MSSLKFLIAFTAFLLVAAAQEEPAATSADFIKHDFTDGGVTHEFEMWTNQSDPSVQLIVRHYIVSRKLCLIVHT
jgi:hypothetical protein